MKKAMGIGVDYPDQKVSRTLTRAIAGGKWGYPTKGSISQTQSPVKPENRPERKIHDYEYSTSCLKALESTGVLELDFQGMTTVSRTTAAKLQKSLFLADRVWVIIQREGRLHKSGEPPAGITAEAEKKAKEKWPAGSRWITIHPHGEGEKGVPVLIRDNGDGTAHVIAGAGGRLNLLKLNKILSPEEAKARHKEKRDIIKTKKKVERKAERERVKLMFDGDKLKVKAYFAAKRARQKAVDQAKTDTESQFFDAAKNLLGWKPDPLSEQVEAEKNKYLEEAAKQESVGEAAKAEEARKKARQIEKAHHEAYARQKNSLIGQAKEVLKNFKTDLVRDKDLRAAVRDKLGAEDDHADDVIRKEKSGKSLGFVPGYEKSAREKGLTDEGLGQEKKELLEKKLDEIGRERGEEVRDALEKRIQAMRGKNEAVKEIYQRQEFDQKVCDLDTKVELLKKHAAMEKALAELGKRDEKAAKKKNAEGLEKDLEADWESTSKFASGVRIESRYTSEDLVEDLKREETRLEAERQARLNGDFLESVNRTPGAGKWIANGVYNGFNSLSQVLLKGEALSRDVVDVLGVGNAAKLLAYRIAKDKPEEVADIAQGVSDYHKATSEMMVSDAKNKAQALLSRAEDLELQTARTPGDLLLASELAEQRLGYIDQAHRILGQCLGTLEAQAALVHELEARGAGDLVVSLGGSTSQAIIKLRAIGLAKEDYELDQAGKNLIARVFEPGKLKILENIDPREIQLQDDVDRIKRGFEDEKDFLPTGLVSRPFESFQEPQGELPESEKIENTDETREALHRSLGEIPQGKLAYKGLDDLSPQDQTDLRHYWEDQIYQGSDAQKTAGEAYALGGGISKQKAWRQFEKTSGGQEAARAIIRDDLAANHSREDMFGEKVLPPLAKVVEGQWDTYKGVPGARGEFEKIESLADDLAGGLVHDQGQAEKELSRLEKELPAKLSGLYSTAMLDHWHTHMSPYNQRQYQAGEGRKEKSPWGEYVRMHGNVERALASVQDVLKGNFNQRFAGHYARVARVKLKSEPKEIRNLRDHSLALLSKEDRDSYKTKAEKKLASAGATVANRKNGRFASGSWKDAAWDHLRKREKNQLSMFADSELDQKTGKGHYISLPTGVEESLKGILPEASANQRRGELYRISPEFSMSSDKHVQQQRAIKMFAKVGRMNLSFGTGKGKSITSIGAFAHLKSQGLAKRSLFVVPQAVQAQFGGEMASYTKPGAFKWQADPALDREGRVAALKDPKNDMVVMTHQGLRDDLVHLIAQDLGVDEAAAKNRFNAMNPSARKTYLAKVLGKNGIKLDMLTVDESHYASNRKGKEDSTLSNVLDALNQNTPYFLNQSATPVKNDPSEAFDMLKKVDPGRFHDRDEFLKRYGVDTLASKTALRRLLGRYNYASPTETGVKRNNFKESIELTGDQKKAHDEVLANFERVRSARRKGQVDVKAMEALSPGSFKGLSDEERKKAADRLSLSAGIIKEEALNRVINSYPPEKNAKVQKVLDLVRSKTYREDHPASGAFAGDQAPGVIFAHNLASLENLKTSLTKQGLRVGLIHGGMTGEQKEAVKTAYHPKNPRDRKYDVLLLSDAGATGLNLQNSKYLINYDLPQTAWVKQQREGRIDRHGQVHEEIDYHDLVSNTRHEASKWDRIGRKATLGEIFQNEDPAQSDDTGVLDFIAKVKHDREMTGAA